MIKLLDIQSVKPHFDFPLNNFYILHEILRIFSSYGTDFLGESVFLLIGLYMIDCFFYYFVCLFSQICYTYIKYTGCSFFTFLRSCDRSW